jgi:hypothetical protein
MDEDDRPPLRVAVVGVSAAGKSTLVRGLRARGYDARHVAQEHSGVPDMWQRIGRPDVLIYLDAGYETTCARRSMLGWGLPQFERERARLAHARAHCDLYLATDDLSAEEVLQRALMFLRTPE